MFLPRKAADYRPRSSSPILKPDTNGIDNGINPHTINIMADKRGLLQKAIALGNKATKVPYQAYIESNQSMQTTDPVPGDRDEALLPYGDFLSTVSSAPPPGTFKVTAPISVKLISIITVLILVSLGLLTTLVSVLVTKDARITAENNNFSINQKTAAVTEAMLRTIRFDVQVFLNTVEALDSAPQERDTTGREGIIGEVEAYFFRQRKDIAAIILMQAPEGSDAPTGQEAPGTGPFNRSFINTLFFENHELDTADLAPYLRLQQAAVVHSQAGQVLLQNAAPAFSMPLVALFFPWQPEATPGNGAAADKRPQAGGPLSAVVFFSSENLTENFGSGANTSFMINDEGDILIHSDQNLVKAHKNLQHIAFVQDILQGSRHNPGQGYQNPYIDEDKIEYFGAFQRIFIGNTEGNAVVITIIQRDVVFEGIRMTTLRNIYLSVAALFLAIDFIWFFSHTISRPLILLSRAAWEIEEGRYNLDLRVKNRDETGVLTNSFISMSYALANFERFTNKTIVAMARKGKLSLGGAYKTATVCFAFIRDFSEMAAEFDAQEVVEFVNDYLRRMVPCVTHTRGEVDKFLTQGGVVIMALWGTLESAGSPKRDALNCIKAVLMMRASLCALNHERREQGKPLIKMGCGINTGAVVAGQMGSNERMEYTVIGDTVNFAARVEGPNEAFDTDILITENTWNLVGQYLVTTEMPGFEVKGKEKPVRVFAVVNMQSGGSAGKEAEDILKDLEKLPGTNPLLARRCVGPEGPTTLAEMRARWVS
jgi:adenylate cyclase